MTRPPPARSSADAPRVVSAGFHERVYAVVRCIPKGAVASYGQIAEMLGHPGVARHVGNALAACDRAQPPVPWHRVVNARGQISTRGSRQAQLLEREGVRFNQQGAVDLERHRWQPEVRRAARRPPGKANKAGPRPARAQSKPRPARKSS